jgi:hypothetical protein
MFFVDRFVFAHKLLTAEDGRASTSKEHANILQAQNARVCNI